MRPVDREVRAGDAVFQERTIEAVERDEEAVVSKTARVTEEITLGKDVEMIRLPGETHGALSGSPVHRVEARRAILAYLERHLNQ